MSGLVWKRLTQMVAIGALWGCMASVAIAQSQANAQELDGDEGLACEAILCLAASGGQPAECAAALRRYYSISYRWWSDTLRGRLNFLNLCPIVSSDMSNLKSAIANGAGRCDAASLNQELVTGSSDESPGYISNTLPDYCTTLFSSSYIQAQAPRYVGTPWAGGYWVEAVNFEAASAAFNAR
jgi:hypothetical protein